MCGRVWRRLVLTSSTSLSTFTRITWPAWSRPLYQRGRSLLGQPGGRDVGHLEVEPQAPHLLAVGHEQGHDDPCAQIGALLDQPQNTPIDLVTLPRIHRRPALVH